jgi:hypothetical protein
MPYQATSAATLPTAKPSHTPPGSGRSSHAAPAMHPGRISKPSMASATAHDASCSRTACQVPAARRRQPPRWAVARQAAAAVFAPMQP